MDRIDFNQFKSEALKNAELKKEYDRLTPVYDLKKRLIALRKASGFTQEELAEKLHTQKSNISRLENVNSKNSPKLSTIEAYAKAMGYNMEINFIPVK